MIFTHLFYFAVFEIAAPWGKIQLEKTKVYFPILARNLGHDLKCYPVFPLFCAGFSSVSAGCAGARCAGGNLFGWICVHRESSTIGAYLQLDTVAAVDLVPTERVFGKGGLL